MKKVLVIVAFYLLVVTPVFAQEEATTPAKPKSKIEEIKEKIASTVAQLNLVSKKGFVGQISKLEKTQITIEKNGEARIVEIDELTKYQELTDKKRTDITFADLDVGDYLVAVGLYNKESRKLLGRFILVKDIPVNINGVVPEVGIQAGTISVEDKKKGKTFMVDVERTTIVRVYAPGQGLIKSGLSKIEIGQRAHVYGTLSKEEENRIVGSRILLLPGKAIGITAPPTATPSATKAATPSATPKPTKKPTPTQIP